MPIQFLDLTRKIRDQIYREVLKFAPHPDEIPDGWGEASEQTTASPGSHFQIDCRKQT